MFIPQEFSFSKNSLPVFIKKMTAEGPILTEFLKADIFSGLGKWQALVASGAVTPKLLRFMMAGDEGEKMLYLASIISKNEKMMRQSFEELLGHSVKLAAARLQGIFGLDILSADIQMGSRNFNLQDFSTLLVNHGRSLEFGQQKSIRYGQIFCLLHKRAPADWGKIDVSYHVEIVDAAKMRFSSFLKKMMKAGGDGADAIYLIHDLGLSPVWDLGQEEFPASVHYYHLGRES